MRLLEFLETSSLKHGPALMEGAMVFIAMDRPLDQIIRHASSWGPYHHGTLSPWSHCFLIGEEYQGGETKIFDCTIRDDNNKVIWDSTLVQDIEVMTRGFQGKKGKIYSGHLSDYDDERIQNCGLYFLPALTAKERRKIVKVAAKLQRQGYRYDFPGLAREFVKLLIGVTWKPGKDRLLFCSAFLASVYRASLTKAWNVAPGISSADVTLDDIWYSGIGVRESVLAV